MRTAQPSISERRSPDASGAAWLLGQLPAALGFKLAPLSPRAVNLTGRVPAAECDDGRDESEYERADRGNDFQHHDDGDDGRDDGNDCFHGADYRIPASSESRESVKPLSRQSSLPSSPFERARSGPVSVTWRARAHVRRPCCLAERWSVGLPPEYLIAHSRAVAKTAAACRALAPRARDGDRPALRRRAAPAMVLPVEAAFALITGHPGTSRRHAGQGHEQGNVGDTVPLDGIIPARTRAPG